MNFKKFIKYLNYICFCTLFCLFSFVFAGCSSKNEETYMASLNTTTVGKTSLSISITNKPYTVQFTSNTPTLLEEFGSETYNCINICLAGIVNTEEAKLNATPIKQDGSPYTSQDQPQDLFCYTDYFQFAFPISSYAKTIRFSKDEPLTAIEKNRVIDNYYYLNLKWLNLSPDKHTIKTFEYENDNYIYIQVNSVENTTSTMFLLHLTFDITFV